jgi:hypothetical protein
MMVMASRMISGHPPARRFGQAGVDANGGKEVHQQQIACRQIELHRHTACPVKQPKKQRE